MEAACPIPNTWRLPSITNVALLLLAESNLTPCLVCPTVKLCGPFPLIITIALLLNKPTTFTRIAAHACIVAPKDRSKHKGKTIAFSLRIMLSLFISSTKHAFIAMCFCQFQSKCYHSKAN